MNNEEKDLIENIRKLKEALQRDFEEKKTHEEIQEALNREVEKKEKEFSKMLSQKLWGVNFEDDETKYETDYWFVDVIEDLGFAREIGIDYSLKWTRNSWEENEYIFYSHGNGIVKVFGVHGEHFHYIPGQDDLFAKDWEPLWDEEEDDYDYDEEDED